MDRIFIHLFTFFNILFLNIILTQMQIFPSVIHYQHRFYTYKEKEKLKLLIAIFVLLMSDHQFLFGFVFSPFLLLWKMWKIIDGREWGWG